MKHSQIIRSLICIFTALGFVSADSYADTVLLTNGDRISGEIQQLEGAALKIKTDYSAIIDIKLDAVSSFSTDENRSWKIDQAQRETKIEISTSPHYVIVNNEQVAIDTLTLTNITVAPKWKKSGHLDTSIEVQDKATHQEKLHLNGDINLESDHWRHTFKTEIKREHEEGKYTEDSAELNYALDYLINNRWLIRSESEYLENNIGDRTQYTYTGLGPGYRLWGEGRDRLDIIAAYNYFWLSSDIFDLELKAWSVSVDFKKYWFDEKLETFADLQVAFPDFAGLDRLTDINIGLRYLLTKRIYLSLKYDLNETRSALGSSKETSTILGAGVNF
jgi:hypothetical protein